MFSFFSRQKLTDLEIIAKLEKRIGRKLEQLNEIKWGSIGYQLNNSQQIIGLSLCKCNITNFPSEITQLTNLTWLDLHSNQLKKLPAQIGNLTNLTWLSLNDNQLKELSAQIGNLSKLTKLGLSGNQLKELPSSIGNLTNLTWLSLNDNQLKELSAQIGNLTNLTELRLWGNQLTELPAQIGNLTNLTKLYLCENQLKELPAQIGNLTNITELNLENNQLTALPSSIGNLKKLKQLNLSNNLFKQFPKVLLDLNSEIVWKNGYYNGGINVYGNPFEVPPVEIVEQGKQAIIEYFKALEGEEKPLNEAKLILIGDGGAGKTSLMKCLSGETFNPQESQTHGINIQQLNFYFNNNEIKLNCWDFGGQQIMHATHQFFLSKRSLYVLVVDSRRESHVDYWLKHIQTFAENAPVIIVLNKIDENPHFDVLRRQLKQNYPNIKAFCRLSCATNEGINDLKNTIQTVLPNIELLNTLFPQRWFEVKNAIAAQAIHKNFTSYDHYIDICQQYKIFEESEQHTLINFLHDLGLVIHFSDAWLRETNVINPQWLTEAIYTIINAPSLANHGKLLKNQLVSLLNTQIYPSHKHDYLLELMKKFELCFSLDQQTFLLPDLFPAHEPDFDFDFQHAIHFILEYDFLPKSVFTRLIVRMHHAIKNNYYWRTGVVLFDPTYQTTAFIETNQQQLKLHLQGNKAREYLTVLQFVLNDIHQSFSHLKITHKIGLPDHPEITVSYEYLLKLLENKQTNYVPQELPTKSYKINELLGVFSIEKWSDDQIAQILTSMNQVLENIGLKQEELLSRGEEIFEIKPELMGISVDLKALWRKFKK